MFFGFLNQVRISDAVIHILAPVMSHNSHTVEVIFSRICLLAFLRFDFTAGFIRRYFGIDAKLSLWALRVMKHLRVMTLHSVFDIEFSG